MKRRKKTATKKSRTRKPARRKTAASTARRRGRRTAAGSKRRGGAAKARSRKKATKKRRTAAPKKRTLRVAAAAGAGVERPRARLVQGWKRGLGAGAAGQAGDLEAIPRGEDVDSESVEELLEEGQSWEAGIVSGVENADDGEGEVRTREVPEDDVPEEYRDDED